ncbi:MAG: glycosyltransferase family 39 protein [Gemmatimonadaceae bacterium]
METVRLSSAARQTLIVILVSAAARLVLAAVLGLGVDESYEVVMSRVPSLSYFDHPPLSFWIAGLTSRAVQTEQRVLLRLPFIALFAVSTLLMYRLTARWYGERAGFVAALLLNVSPVFSLSTGGWVLPDGPLDCALLAAASCASRAVGPPLAESGGPRVEGDERGHWAWWIGAGLCAGLALLSKYHGVFVVLGVLLFLATTREARWWLRMPQPYVAVAIVLVLTLPVVIWNVRHDFASFRFQLGRAAAHGLRAAALAQNLGGQVGYLLPWIALPLLWQLWRGLRVGPTDAPRWFLCCLAMGPIILFTLVSLGGNPGLPHWPAPGYLFLFPLLGDAVARYEDRGVTERRRVTRALVASVTVFVALAATAASAVATGWPARVAPSLFRRGDPTLEAIDWRDLEPTLGKRSLLAATAPIFTTHWIDAAKAGYALGSAHDVYCLCSDPRGFQYAFPPRRALGRDGVVLVRARADYSDSVVANAYRPYFKSLELMGHVAITRAGRSTLEISVFRAAFLRRLPQRIDP